MERYFEDSNTTLRNGKDGPEQLSNFTARIEKQLIYHDAHKTSTVLLIKGTLHTGENLPPVLVNANEFAGMGWVSERWGMTPVIFAVTNAERDLKTAVQLASAPATEHIYTHTGWTTLKDSPAYLTTSGAITRAGLDPSINVQLPGELRLYKLPSPAQSREAFLASLRLVNLGPRPVMWTMWLATFRAALGDTDFAVHLAGKTGTYKSELCSLFQSHYGAEMDARKLPASWNSTGNALEALAYHAKNAVMVVDDFVPTGSSYQVKSLNAKADALIRAQGNAAGRSRLTDLSHLQTAMFPRGIIFSTGEDVPEGLSVRGRMIICELSPGDITPERLTDAQGKRAMFPQAMADWVHYLTGNDARLVVKSLATKIRDENLATIGGHSRTASIVGELSATAGLLWEYAENMNWLTNKQAADTAVKAKEAVLAAARGQEEWLETADPVAVMLEAIKSLISSYKAHIATVTGGIPRNAQEWGWTEQRTEGQMPDYRQNGPRLGWLDTMRGELLLDPSTLPLLRRASGDRLAVTQQTLVKRIKDAGILARQDEPRGRIAVRDTVDGARRTVLALNLQIVMDSFS